MKSQTPMPPVHVVVHLKAGSCQTVRTNLPDDSWDYSVIDDDKEPGLSDSSAPVQNTAEKTMPSVPLLLELMNAAQQVVAHWESGDLAAAVRALAQILAQLESQP